MSRRAEFIRRSTQAVLVAAIFVGLFAGRWSLVFVSVLALVLAMLPNMFARWVGIRLPASFLAAIAFFVFATVFLGEAFDFYERYWWWDITLHFGSAAGFGLIGFLFIFMLFEGDRYSAPPSALAFLSFCFAMTVGALWEVFEFSMDQLFGLNMQKSGLIDTMWDLIVDAGGATLGAMAGYLYLKGRQLGGLTEMIEEFARLNRAFFAKLKPRK